MANYSYIGYDTTSIIFSGTTVSRSSSYNPNTNRVVFNVTDGAGGNVLSGRADNGVIFDGDRYRDEVGDDFTQTGTVTDLTGTTTIASGNIYLEETYSLIKPDGGTINMYLVEVNGTAVGYIVSEPLFARYGLRLFHCQCDPVHRARHDRRRRVDRRALLCQGCDDPDGYRPSAR